MVSPTDYDSIARRYAAQIDERPWNVLYERPAMLALLPDVNGKDVFDAGCGHDWYADWLVRKGARVVAVDRSRDMVTLARERPEPPYCIAKISVPAAASLLAEVTCRSFM